MSSRYCIDCGIEAWMFDEGNGRIVHEDFYVHDDLWASVCPDDRDSPFVICIGCFEQRLGRNLVHADFTVPPATTLGQFEYTPSTRFLNRWQ